MSTLAHFRLGHPTQRRSTATTGRSSVPWSGVMSLAVVLTLADGFWITSLRGAVGAIERVQSPFASWLRESALVLPVFVLAVLGALTLGLRWVGPAAHRKHTVLASTLLMVAITTLAGVALLIASSAYDLYLQGRMLVMMDSMRGMCTTDCDSLQKAQFWLQVRSIGFGTGVLLATNLVVVGWLVALRGGRLDLTKAGSDVRTATGTRSSRLDDVRVYVAAGIVGSAVVHAA